MCIVVWIILGILIKVDDPNIVLMSYDWVEGLYRCDSYECDDWITMNILYCSHLKVYRKMPS